MVALSLVPLGTRLAALLLRASAMMTAPPPPSNDATADSPPPSDDAAAAPFADGAAAPVEEVRAGWHDIAALGKRGDEAAEVLGGRIASRLEAEVADARRRCEERGVDAGLLRGAVIEAESLLGELAVDDAVITTIARDPDRAEQVIRGRVQRRRLSAGAGAEPFFDALVRAITEEITRPAPSGSSRSEPASDAAPPFQSMLEQIKNQNPRQAAIARRQLEILALLAASGVPARWMRAAD